MNPLQFDNLIQHFRELEDQILNYKRGEYAPSTDRLENFRSIQAISKFKMSEIALIYLLKHIQSIAVKVKNGDLNWEMTTEANTEGLKQRFVDAINYLYLLAACIEEEKGDPSSYSCSYPTVSLGECSKDDGIVAPVGVPPISAVVELKEIFKRHMKARGVEIP